MDRHPDHHERQTDGDKRVGDQRQHLGGRLAGEADDEPDEEGGEGDVEGAGHPLGDEVACCGLAVAVVGARIEDLRAGRLAAHLNHTKIAQTRRVRTMEAPSCRRTASSRPAGSIIWVKSTEERRMPPNMWWTAPARPGVAEEDELAEPAAEQPGDAVAATSDGRRQEPEHQQQRAAIERNARRAVHDGHGRTVSVNR